MRNSVISTLQAILLTSLAALAPCLASAQTAADITDLILVTGQSNVTGSQTEYDPTVDASHPRVFAFTTTKAKNAYSIGGTWQQADLHQAWDVDGWHPGNGSLTDATRQPYNNFAFHMAKTIADSDANKVVGIVVVSAPGEGIQHWDVDGDFGGSKYSDGTTFAQVIEAQALAALNAQGVKSTFDAIIWHQGETDWQIEGTSDPDVLIHYQNDSSYNPGQDTTYYPDKLTALITRSRNSNWFDEGKAFICGETKQAPINQQLMALNDNTDPWTGCVTANDLSTRDASSTSVGTHFDAAGLRTLGQRYAEKYLEINGVDFNTSPVRVMAVGDSITQGVNGQDSYRPEFADLLTASSCDFDMVGSRGTTPNFHEGYSGHTADHLINGLGTNPGIDAMMAAQMPEVVLLHIGSNDMRLGQTVSSTVDDIDTIITEIKTASAANNLDTTILVANLIPWWGEASNSNVTLEVESLGDEIETLVSNRADPSIVLVDVREGFTRSMMLTDLIHPNSAGESFVADAFFDAYGLFYSCAQSLDLTAPRTFITSPAENENTDGTTSFSGVATDTGGSGFSTVRVAVRDTDTQLWYSFSDGTFGSINNGGISNATIDPATRTESYVDWSLRTLLPDGSYELFAVAEDKNGNNAYDGLGISLWPVSTVFTVSTVVDPMDASGAQFTTQLQSPSTGHCISVPDTNTTPGANVDSSACVEDAANQTLHFVPVANLPDSYTIEFEHSGLCLNVADGSTSNGASLNQATCNNNASQQFSLIDEGSFIALVSNTRNYNQVVDSHAQTDDIIQWRDYGNTNQRWLRINTQTATDVPLIITPAPLPDADNDGTPDATDPFPQDAANDNDNDGISGPIDNCPMTANPNQNDADNNGIGDACDSTPLPITPVEPITPVDPPQEPGVETPDEPPVLPTEPTLPVAQFTTQLQSPSTGLCISIPDANTSVGANVDSSVCSDNAEDQTLQFFQVNNQSNTFTIQFEHSGLCLNVANSSTANGTSLNQAVCNDSTAQQFTLLEDGTRIALFTNTGRGDQVIDSHAQTDDVIQWRDYGNNNQRWIRTNTQTPTVDSSVNMTVAQPDLDNDGLPDATDPFPQDPDNDSDNDGVSGPFDNCPAIANAGQNDADNDSIGDACDSTPLPITPVEVEVEVEAEPDTPAEPIAGPTAPIAQFTTQLQSPSTGLCISVSGDNSTTGANVDSSLCSDNAANQTLQFFLVSDQNDTYTIEFEHSGLCLNVPDNSTANGASLQQAVCDGRSTQQFTLIDNGTQIALFTNTGRGNQVIDSHAQTDDIIQWRDYGNSNQRWIRTNLLTN